MARDRRIGGRVPERALRRADIRPELWTRVGREALACVRERCWAASRARDRLGGLRRGERLPRREDAELPRLGHGLSRDCFSAPRRARTPRRRTRPRAPDRLSLIHISEPTRLGMISYA